VVTKTKTRFHFGFCAMHNLSDSDLAILSVHATHGYRPYILLPLRVQLNAAKEREKSLPLLRVQTPLPCSFCPITLLIKFTTNQTQCQELRITFLASNYGNSTFITNTETQRTPVRDTTL
jgi:hypothetical protein